MTTRPVSVLLAALCLSAASPLTTTPAGAQTALTIAGVVKDADGGVVPGARVSVDGQTAAATTDGGGAYTVTVPAPGRYTVRASFPGAAGGSRVVDVAAPMTAVDLDLGPLVASEAVTVVGRTVGDLGLNGSPTTASRLGLRALDIPASIDVLDSRVMDARGYQKVSDAVGRMAGVVSGEHPTAPSSFTMRGFTASQVATLRDGIWAGTEHHGDAAAEHLQSGAHRTAARAIVGGQRPIGAAAADVGAVPQRVGNRPGDARGRVIGAELAVRQQGVAASRRRRLGALG